MYIISLHLEPQCCLFWWVDVPFLNHKSLQNKGHFFWSFTCKLTIESPWYFDGIPLWTIHSFITPKPTFVDKTQFVILETINPSTADNWHGYTDITSINEWVGKDNCEMWNLFWSIYESLPSSTNFPRQKWRIKRLSWELIIFYFFVALPRNARQQTVSQSSNSPNVGLFWFRCNLRKLVRHVVRILWSQTGFHGMWWASKAWLVQDFTQQPVTKWQSMSKNSDFGDHGGLHKEQHHADFIRMPLITLRFKG